MNAHLLREFHGAYLRMAPFYRPAAPGDGMGHVHLTPEQCRDGPRLYREAYDYAAELVAEDDTPSSISAAVIIGPPRLSCGR
jgi:hypothetical protein